MRLRVRALALLILLSGMTIAPTRHPDPNGRIHLYLMGSPTPQRMEVARIAEIVEVERVSRALRELGGSRAIFYDWLFARYEWERSWLDERRFLVRFDGPYGPALAYDYGSEEVRSLRAKELVDTMVRWGYDGVFFDWFPVACDPELAEESAPGYVRAFSGRHPGQSMKEALLEFLKELREEGERRGLSVVVVSNQAYRCGPEVMASVDWDISESYFSDVRDGTVLRPWETGNWDSPATYVPLVVSSVYDEARKINFRLGFTHLSYATPGDREAAFYAFAGAMVFGHDGIAQAPSEMEGEVVPAHDYPNAYWLGCFQYRMNASEWALAVYDLGIVGAGQVPLRVPDEIRGLFYDLKGGQIVHLSEMGREGPWGAVYLRIPDRLISLSCPSLEVRVPWSELTEGAMRSISNRGGCDLEVVELGEGEGISHFSLWREARREVAIVANDIDWEVSGLLLAGRLREEGIDVFRAPLTLQGLKEALLDSKVVIVLGGPESPVTGSLLEPLTSRTVGWEDRLGPGRVIMWLWGEDRYKTRGEVISHLQGMISGVKEVLSPLPRCPAGLSVGGRSGPPSHP